MMKEYGVGVYTLSSKKKDTRTPAMSQSERQKGGGYESEINYTGWRRICKSIDRYHFFLDSYSKLMEACSDMNSSSDKWMTRLTISSWLTHIKEILNCGCLAAQCVDKVGTVYPDEVTRRKQS